MHFCLVLALRSEINRETKAARLPILNFALEAVILKQRLARDSQTLFANLLLMAEIRNLCIEFIQLLHWMNETSSCEKSLRIPGNLGLWRAQLRILEKVEDLAFLWIYAFDYFQVRRF